MRGILYIRTFSLKRLTNFGQLDCPEHAVVPSSRPQAAFDYTFHSYSTTAPLSHNYDEMSRVPRADARFRAFEMVGNAP